MLFSIAKQRKGKTTKEEKRDGNFIGETDPVILQRKFFYDCSKMHKK